MLLKQAGRDHRHAVSTRHELPPQPDEGKDIAGTAEGEEEDVRHE
jgi:hypothetical protein